MKKTLSVILALVMALTLVIGPFSTASAASTPAQTIFQVQRIVQNHGAYVMLRGIPVSGAIKFDYGWTELNQFASPAVGYFLGLYNVTQSHYEWSFDQQFTMPVPNGTIGWKSLDLSFADTSTLSPGDYKIVFFVRGSYGPPVTNVASIDGLRFCIH
jgi:hypothetical protein